MFYLIINLRQHFHIRPSTVQQPSNRRRTSEPMLGRMSIFNPIYYHYRWFPDRATKNVGKILLGEGERRETS